MNLWSDFKNNNGKIIHKWMHYFPIYEKLFSDWRNKNVVFLEVGVSKGGSLQMWQRYFGPLATVVGIDINPKCKEFEEDGIHIRIGDQSNPEFLKSLEDEFGQFDIILDDGSHQMGHIFETFKFFYPRISKNGIYAVEDLHTAYWSEYGGGLDEPSSFVNISKGFTDSLNAHHTRGELKPDFVANNTLSITFYDSVIAYQRGNIPIRKAPKYGKDSSA
jgi:hypothetical protein